MEGATIEVVTILEKEIPEILEVIAEETIDEATNQEKMKEVITPKLQIYSNSHADPPAFSMLLKLSVDTDQKFIHHLILSQLKTKAGKLSKIPKLSTTSFRRTRYL